MKTKTGKKILIILIAVIILGAAVTFFFISRHNAKYISKTEAVEIAMKDAGLTTANVFEYDVDFEKSNISSYYDVDLDSTAGEYEYKIDAVSGDVLFFECEGKA